MSIAMPMLCAALMMTWLPSSEMEELSSGKSASASDVA